MRVDDPAGTVLLAENDNQEPRENAGAGVNTAQLGFTPCRDARQAMFHTRWNQQPMHASGRLGAHHAGGLNIIYVDGHARWSRTPPADCHAWVSSMAAGARLITNPSTVACNVNNVANDTWCNSN